jgi:hypothetical protein
MVTHIFITLLSSENPETPYHRVAFDMGLDSLARHDSSHYTDDEYFTASALGIKVIFAVADRIGFEDCNVELSLRPGFVWQCTDDHLDACADVIAELLTRKGYRVCRGKRLGTPAACRCDYTLKTHNRHANELAPIAVSQRPI